ncbi:MAG: 1-deoxy-D-xylulose-5-phosphate reductoisomerase [Acidimicrobiales bacterium]|nr:1-deoxy-D-xylulose-5-phosphate reductoisomerase [Acidimicrobiales bacterium]
MKRIAILGSTGSIGKSALAVVVSHSDRVQVVGLAAGQNVDLLAQQIHQFKPTVVSLSSPDAVERLRGSGALGQGISAYGENGLTEVATHPDVDFVLCASSGTAALEATLAAIEAGKTIALANKEVLVMAGSLMVEAARRHKVKIFPVDSEHNAIYQCVDGRASDVVRYVLTASGGPFREREIEEFGSVTPEEALQHPTWAMGPKITVDSATMMNKGLEVIEARWLFDAHPDQIDVVIHPQSVVHSLVEFRDGSMIAQLGVTDMRLPIQYALSYPERWTTPVASLDLTACGPLEFLAPDTQRFPCLSLAYKVLSGGGGLSTVLNAANEVAVAAFLSDRLAFNEISSVIEQTLNAAWGRSSETPSSLSDVREVDAWARVFSESVIAE